MLAARLAEALAQLLGDRHAVAREELDGLLGRLVGAEQAVFGVVAAAVDASVEQIVEAEHHFRARGLEQALAAHAGVDVAGDDGVGVVAQRLHAVAENDLDLSARILDNAGVEVDVVDARERVHRRAELFAELRERQNVAVRVDARLVELVPVDKAIAHLVRGVGEQQHDLPAAHRHAAQQQRKAVAAQDWERDAHGAAAGLFAHILRDLAERCVVALRTRHDGLRHGDDVAVARLDACFLPRLHHGSGSDLSNVVSLADDGCAHAAHDSSDRSHLDLLLYFMVSAQGALAKSYSFVL